MHNVRFSGVLFAFLIGILISPVLPADAQENSSNPDNVPTETLTVGTAFPDGFIENTFIERLPEALEERAPGYFEIDFRGGPGAFPPNELYTFVQRGAVDIGNVPTSFYAHETYAPTGMNIPEMPAHEWREISIHNWVNELLQPEGIQYLAQSMGGIGFHCYTKDAVEVPEDLEGMQLYGVDTWRPLLETFGAELVEIPPPEIYTALERGVIDGLCWPNLGMVVEQEWYKELNYAIDPGFLQVELSLIMNRDRWNQLSESHQEALMDTLHHLQQETHEYFQEQEIQARQQMIEGGMEEVDFTGDARDRWVEASYREFWKHLMNHAQDPDDIRRLNQILVEHGQETHFPEDYSPE